MNLLNKIIIALFLFIFLQVSVSAAGAGGLATNNNACYKTRDMLFPKEDVFEALKTTLLQSNLNIVTVTKDDGVLTAKGSQYNEEDDTVTDITMSISFKEVGVAQTHIISIASYSTREIKSETHQLGAAGISLPIPVPLTGRYVNTGSGNIDDSVWYQGFYNSVALSLFENKMKYIKADKKEEVKEVVDAKKEEAKEVVEAKKEEAKEVVEVKKEEAKVVVETKKVEIKEVIETKKIEIKK